MYVELYFFTYYLFYKFYELTTYFFLIFDFTYNKTINTIQIIEKIITIICIIDDKIEPINRIFQPFELTFKFR